MQKTRRNRPEFDDRRWAYYKPYKYICYQINLYSGIQQYFIDILDLV